MEKEKRGQRSDFTANHKIVREEWLKLVKSKAKAPTTEELAAATGLSVSSIKKHLKAMKFEAEDSPWRLLTPEVIHAIYDSATSLLPGSQSDRKLWMQLVEGWSEKTSTDVTSGGEVIKQTIKIGEKEISFE